MPNPNILRKIVFPGCGFAFDVDAQTFFDTASITEGIHKTAVNNLVIALKDKEVWDLCDVIYPIVGGSAGQHSYNLKDPTTNQITWFNTPTQDSNGVDYNGTNEYGDTGFLQAQNFSHIGAYIKDNVANTSQDIGVLGANDKSTALVSLNAAGTRQNLGISASNIQTSSKNTSVGNHLGQRISNTQIEHWIDGVKFTGSSASSATPTTYTIYFGARNNKGTADIFASRRSAFYTIGQRLTDTEVEDYNTIITDYQTELSRQI